MQELAFQWDHHPFGMDQRCWQATLIGDSRIQPRCRASLCLSVLSAVSGPGKREKVDSEGTLVFQM